MAGSTNGVSVSVNEMGMFPICILGLEKKIYKDIIISK